MDVFLTNFRLVLVSEDTHAHIENEAVCGSYESNLSAGSDTFMEDDLTERIRMHSNADLSTCVMNSTKRDTKEERPPLSLSLSLSRLLLLVP